MRRTIFAIAMCLAAALPAFGQYDFTGVGWDNVDPTRPQGKELGSAWAPSLRQTRQAGISSYQLLFGPGGIMKTSVVPGYAIADGAVTLEKIGADVQAAISGATTGAVANIVITNATLYYTSQEGDGTATQTLTIEQTLGTLTLGSNGCRKVLLTAEVFLNNQSGSLRTWSSVNINVNGNRVKSSGPFQAAPAGSREVLVPISVVVNGQQNSSVPVTVSAVSDNNTANSSVTAVLKTFRIWLIP